MIIAKSDFEQQFSEHIGEETYCLFLNSGQSAIEVAMYSLEIEKGSKVLIPVIGCDAIAMSVLNIGCVPVFYDLDEHFNIVLNENQDDISAIVIVYQFGMVTSGTTVEDINSYRRKGWKVIADCAQAFDTRLNGIHVGQFADVAIFSFADGKQIECGEGGALFSKSENYVMKAKEFANAGKMNGCFNRYIVGRNLIMSRIIMQYFFSQLHDWPMKRKERKEREEILYNTLKDISQISFVSVHDAYETTLHKFIFKVNDLEVSCNFQNTIVNSLFFQRWQPLLPIEKKYLAQFKRNSRAVAFWKSRGIMCRLDPNLSRGAFYKECIRVRSTLRKEG